MSVNSAYRKISKSEYINVGMQIYALTERVYRQTRSNYRDYIGDGLVKCANNFMDTINIIASINPNSKSPRNLYHSYFEIQRCIGLIKAIDNRVSSFYYIVLLENGAEGINKVLPNQNDIKELGEALERETKLLNGMLRTINDSLKAGLKNGFGEEKKENNAEYKYTPLIKNFLKWRDLDYGNSGDLFYEDINAEILKK